MDNQRYQSQQSTNQGTEFQSEKIVYVFVGFVIAAGIFGGYLALANWQNWWPFELKPEQVIYCTQDAMLCPDGSYVGRTGPNCEFKLCPEEVDTSNWQTYRNDEYGFLVRYPVGWELNEPEGSTAGLIVYFQSPETKKGIEEGRIYPVPDLSISFWSTINNEFALGGGWPEQREYKNLDDYFTDGSGPKKKVGEITIDERKSYEVSIDAAGSNYAVMIEHNGIYELSFGTAWDKTQLSLLERQIIPTFRFIDTSVGQFCGGIAATVCPSGYICNLDGNYPDASGTCVKQDSTDCLQVETPARNDATGEIREFSTPCDVPQGWTPLY